MVVVVSGMHLFNRCEGAAVAARGAAHTRVCREFCPLASTQGAAAGAVFAYDAQQLGALSTALWQPGLVPVPKQNLESKKFAELAAL